ncbi:MAG: hypothetical protein ACRDZ5_08500, partial [Acidimicrobiales bacterium]
ANRTVSLRIALESGAVLSLRVHTRAGSAVVGLPEAKIAAGGGVLSMQLTEGPGPAGSTIAEAVAVHLRPGPHTPAFDGPGDRPRWLALNGILQGLLDPPHWRYAGILGPLVLYTNEAPFGSSFLEPLTATGISTARALGSVSEQAATEWQAPSELVDVPEGAWLVRSASYDPGWSASALPVGRSAASASPIHLVVRSFGVLQAVRLPAGVYKVTWRYGSERAEQGLALAAAGTVACMLMLGYEIERLRRRRRRPRRLDREPETCEPRVGRERAGEEERAAFELR